MSRSDCFGRDVWDRKLAQCVYRKCSATCPIVEEVKAKTLGEGENATSSAPSSTPPEPSLNRTSYCCQDNLCNDGERKAFLFVGVIGVAIAVNLIDI
jgi:hypothetical protein